MGAILKVKTENIRKNAESILEVCRSNGIEIAGVIKGCNAYPPVIKTLYNAGCRWIADSRVERLAKIKKKFPSIPLLLLRLPSPSQAEQVVSTADYSLNSELKTLKILNRAARNKDLVHKIILMVELGDLREGIYPADRTVLIADEVEKMKNIHLAGIGTNLSCYGGIVPDEKNMDRLLGLALKIEKSIGRKLEIISGGATTTLPLLLSGKLPDKINHLRLGEAILLNRDLPHIWNVNIEGTTNQTFILETELIEVKEKPSKPVGKKFVDAFGERPEFKDRGEHKRGIAAIGRADIVLPGQLIPREEGMKVLGASSDHLILDIEDCVRDLQTGDRVQFEMFYGPLLHLCESSWVKKKVID
ncbi:MAG: alanine racemase [Halanaerobiales bacterium]